MHRLCLKVDIRGNIKKLTSLKPFGNYYHSLICRCDRHHLIREGNRQQPGHIYKFHYKSTSLPRCCKPIEYKLKLRSTYT